MPSSDEWNEVARHRPLIEYWLVGGADKRSLKLTKIHTLLVRDQELTASYDTLVSAFLDYVQARGFFVDPARVRSPKDKPRVENQVSFGPR